MSASDDVADTELLAALSLCTDLANGLPFETALRTALLALRLAHKSGVPAELHHDVFCLGLLRFLGCTGFAYEEARLVGGDDIALRRAYAGIDRSSGREVLAATLEELRPSLGRLRTVAVMGVAALSRTRLEGEFGRASCEAAVGLAARMAASPALLAGLSHVHERWDGRGTPGGVAGEEVSLLARHLHVAAVAEFHQRQGGADPVRRELGRRSGGQLEPTLAGLFAADAEELLRPLEAPSVWDVALAEARHAPARTVPIVRIAEAFADFVDLQSPYTLGHSRGVGELCGVAAELAGMSSADATRLRCAGYLHDLGRLSVSTGTWDNPGPLSASERERVRLHAYYTERVLAHCEPLHAIGRLAGAHHERIDGSGYHRESRGAALSPSARILAAADSYRAMCEPRAYRPARSSAAAVRELERAVKAGVHDASAVELVLSAAGTRAASARSRLPAGLTKREIDVVRCIARGLSNRETAAKLGMSARTVKHHVAQVYGKANVSSRAGLALFAVEHGLLPADVE